MRMAGCTWSLKAMVAATTAVAAMIAVEASPISRRAPFFGVRPRLQHPPATILTTTNNDVLLEHNVDERIIPETSPSTEERIPTYLQIRGGGGSSSDTCTEQQHILDARSTSLPAALALARSQARLLVVYIPAKGRSGKSKSNNAVATKSLTSTEVGRAASSLPKEEGRQK